eukprot:TRINITY_DN87177_c0_g1_i1.p1 TRINITY_DN87177_c0_g1~~TRINITY_DN87177_c0_g1_i1.p1  ORF type:complete len:224 (+),score=37.92 TRINITY_DN87177_c0_g1_i1:23-694(+)
MRWSFLLCLVCFVCITHAVSNHGASKRAGMKRRIQERLVQRHASSGRSRIARIRDALQMDPNNEQDQVLSGQHINPAAVDQARSRRHQLLQRLRNRKNLAAAQIVAESKQGQKSTIQTEQPKAKINTQEAKKVHPTKKASGKKAAFRHEREFYNSKKNPKLRAQEKVKAWKARKAARAEWNHQDVDHQPLMNKLQAKAEKNAQYGTKSHEKFASWLKKKQQQQ